MSVVADSGVRLGLGRRQMVGSLAKVLALAAFPPCASAADEVRDREVVLNYSDPRGADLALTMVLHADELPKWTRTDVLERSRNRASVTVRRDAASLPQYTIALSRPLRSGAPRGGTPSAVVGNRLSLRAAPLPAGIGPCDAKAGSAGPCLLSGTASSVAVIVGGGAPVGGRSLREFVASKGFVLGDRSVQRVVAALDARGDVDHVDFVGVLQRRDGALAAPDATSAEVLRVRKGGVYEIVTRRQDAKVGLEDVRFGYEGKR